VNFLDLDWCLQWRDTCFANMGQCFPCGASNAILAQQVKELMQEKKKLQMELETFKREDPIPPPTITLPSIDPAMIKYKPPQIVSVPENEAKYNSLDDVKQCLNNHGKIWEPTKVYIKPRDTFGKITGKTKVSSMTLHDLRVLEKAIKGYIEEDQKEENKVLLKCLQEATDKAEEFPDKAVHLTYLLVLHASKWNVKLETGETLEVPYLHLDFRGKPKPPVRPKPNFLVEIKQSECICRGYHHGKCETCSSEVSQLADEMSSALVDGFSGPMEMAITSCVGLPRTWNFNAGLAETCGLCYCCYFLPHNMHWFEVWATNLLRDALVGKSTATRFAMAVVHDGGSMGNFMQQMELPFAYLHDLPVLLLESSELRRAFIETGLMQRTVQFVTGSNDNTLRMWTGRGKSNKIMNVGETVCCVDMTHDWVFAGDFKGRVHKYHRNTYALSRTATTHTREVRSLVVALGFVFTASKDKTAKMSGIESLNIIRTFGHNGVGQLNCIAVGTEFCFTGGDEGALRLSHADKAAKATPIQLPKTGISHMVLNGRSLFMTFRGDDKGQLYLLRDAYTSEGALEAEVVFTANENVRSLAMGGSHLFVATNACIYKLDARKPEDGPVAGIDVTPLEQPAVSKVRALQIFGEIAVVGYFPGSLELGIFNTKTGCRVSLEEHDAFVGHKSNINCIAVG